jgi:hypothetical protein
MQKPHQADRRKDELGEKLERDIDDQAGGCRAASDAAKHQRAGAKHKAADLRERQHLGG